MATMQINLASSWTDGFKGAGTVEGHGFNVKIGIPASMGGSGEGANPKELFVSALASCYLSTLAAISDNKKLPVKSLNVVTESTSDEHQFLVKHTVHVRLLNSSTQEHILAAHKIIEASDSACLLGSLAKKAGVKIEVVPVVEVQPD